jgi:anaerobic selenocysteine-containing dehydrogenase
MRQPLVQPPGDCLEASQIFTGIAEHLGLLPEIPEEVATASGESRLLFGARLMEWAAREPAIRSKMPFILARTLGKRWDSANRAALWGMLMTAPKSMRENAARAGFKPGLDQGDRIFQAICDTPQGLWVGQADLNDPMAGITTPSGKIEVHVPELEEVTKALDAVSEIAALQLPENFPYVLHAGRHMPCNANTLMRNPAWNDGKRACTVAMNPVDITMLGLQDGQLVRVETEAGSETGELEASARVRPGTVLIPHGFGLEYQGQVYGLNVNRLTSARNRDFLGTPLHRYVPCRVEGAK